MKVSSRVDPLVGAATPRRVAAPRAPHSWRASNVGASHLHRASGERQSPRHVRALASARHERVCAPMRGARGGED
jgi:hypothetical protein